MQSIVRPPHGAGCIKGGVELVLNQLANGDAESVAQAVRVGVELVGGASGRHVGSLIEERHYVLFERVQRIRRRDGIHLSEQPFAVVDALAFVAILPRSGCGGEARGRALDDRVRDSRFRAREIDLGDGRFARSVVSDDGLCGGVGAKEVRALEEPKRDALGIGGSTD